MMKPEEVREMCRKLKPVLGDKADKLWYFYLAGDEKARRDMEIHIQIIAEKMLKQEPLKEGQILLNPPSLNEAAGLFYLGDVIYNNKKAVSLGLSPEDFIKQVGIFSITGEGKTNTAMLLSLQLHKAKVPFLVIDWKRSWRNLLSHKDKVPGFDFKSDGSLDDVEIYTIGRDVSPFLWNPFRPPPNADPLLWIATITEVLEKSHISGPGVAHFFNKIYSGMFSKFKDQNDFYPNFYDGLNILENTRAYERELKWKQTGLRILHSFTTGSIAKTFNSRNPVKLEELLEKPVIFELDLEMPKPLRVFFAEIILRWIHLYRLGQGESERIRHVLFLEEAHNLFPKTRIEKESFNSLENVYRELRAFGQGLVSITQHPSLLPIYLLGNCHSLIFLGLQHEADIKAARQSLFMKQEEEKYFSQLKPGEAIVRIKNRIEPCLVKIPLVALKKGSVDDENIKERVGGYFTCSKAKKPEICEIPGISSRDNKEEEEAKYPGPEDFSVKFLVDINNFPISSLTERYKRLGINPRKGNAIKHILVSGDLVFVRKIATSYGWIALFQLTEKGKGILRDAGVKTSDEKEGVAHKFWKFRIAEYYQKRGYKIEIEKEINGKPDIITETKGEKTVIEIETGTSDILGNIQRNLKAGFKEIIVIATNRFAEEKIEKIIRENSLNVKLTNVLSFDI